MLTKIRNKKHEKGFSLLELAVAVGIAAIVAAVGVTASTVFVNGSQTKSEEYAASANSEIGNASARFDALWGEGGAPGNGGGGTPVVARITLPSPVTGWSVLANGKTITCSGANVGDSATFNIDGEPVLVTKRTYAQITTATAGETCTSGITAMDWNGWNIIANRDLRGEDISHWDTSSVTNMEGMLYGSTVTSDISIWDTSNVTTMEYMLAETNFGVEPITAPIGAWDTGSVTNMSYMFNRTNFNQPIGTWDVSNVTTMAYMFEYAWEFNQDIGAWNVSNVTDFEGMFDTASVFNNGGSGNINNWTLSSQPIAMTSMFRNTQQFNQNIGGWNMDAVVETGGMFSMARAFNNGGSNEIGTWNTGNITWMASMFNEARLFNQDISAWDTSKVRSMSGMFLFADVFNQNLSGWNVSQVTNRDNFTHNSNTLWPTASRPVFP